MKTRLFPWLLVVAILLGACAVADPEPGDSSTTTFPSGGIKGPVFIDSTEILYLESFPVQVQLLVRGSLPTPCHKLRWSLEDPDRVIDVALWSVLALGQGCAQVLEPFEVSIALGSFETADSAVVLNGGQIGRVVIGEVPAAGRVSLIGSGWSFGMCGGYCTADLVLIDGSLTLVGGGWTSDEPLYENRGTLTARGNGLIAAAVAGLSGLPLESVYGCPDCADGGATYVVLDRDGVSSRHDMEFGRPPEVLAELHELAMAMIDTLETCRSDGMVIVAGDCDPWQGF
jgi:hypothetical protein